MSISQACYEGLTKRIAELEALIFSIAEVTLESGSYSALPDEIAGQIINVMGELRAENERLKAEQYWDLIEQLRANVGDYDYTLSKCELEAFLSSRAVHKPTQTIRQQLTSARKMLSGLKLAWDSNARPVSIEAWIAILHEALGEMGE